MHARTFGMQMKTSMHRRPHTKYFQAKREKSADQESRPDDCQIIAQPPRVFVLAPLALKGLNAHSMFIASIEMGNSITFSSSP